MFGVSRVKVFSELSKLSEDETIQQPGDDVETASDPSSQSRRQRRCVCFSGCSRTHLAAERHVLCLLPKSVVIRTDLHPTSVSMQLAASQKVCAETSIFALPWFPTVSASGGCRRFTLPRKQVEPDDDDLRRAKPALARLHQQIPQVQAEA